MPVARTRRAGAPLRDRTGRGSAACRLGGLELCGLLRRQRFLAGQRLGTLQRGDRREIVGTEMSGLPSDVRGALGTPFWAAAGTAATRAAARTMTAVSRRRTCIRILLEKAPDSTSGASDRPTDPHQGRAQVVCCHGSRVRGPAQHVSIRGEGHFSRLLPYLRHTVKTERHPRAGDITPDARGVAAGCCLGRYRFQNRGTVVGLALRD